MSKIKPVVTQWLSYPEHIPQVGDELVVCYGDRNKKEVVIWKLSMVGAKGTFKFLRLPDLPTEILNHKK